MDQNPKIIAIVGPTASGKTSLARRLALEYNGELISADSRQVYRGLDLGTGKEGELKANTTGSKLTSAYPELRYLGEIPQWLIDIADPQDTYTVAEYQQAAYAVVKDILARGKTPIFVGGTGLYVSAVFEGYDFSPTVIRDPNNPRHADKSSYKKSPPAWDLLEIGLDLPREVLYQRIDTRVDQRLAEGMIQEAQALEANGLSLDRMRSFGLEYRYLADYLTGQLDQMEMVEQLKFAIHRYARRQLTWFRHHGHVQWINSPEEASQMTSSFLKNIPSS